MPNYQNSKIYKIESLIGNCVYYGSTTKKYLSNRFSAHRYNYNTGIRHSVSKVLQYPDANIYLVESYPCNSKNELNSREGYYIKNNVCVNRCIAGRTDKQYRLDHKEKIKQYRMDHKETADIYNKQYRLNNGQKIKQYRLDNKEKTVSMVNSELCVNVVTSILALINQIIHVHYIIKNI